MVYLSHLNNLASFIIETTLSLKKAPDLTVVTIQREFQTLWKSFYNVHVHSNQTVWEINLRIISKEQKNKECCHTSDF